MRRGLSAALALLVAGGGGAVGARVSPGIGRVEPNDNRVPAGRLRGDTLELGLEVRMAEWRPEGNDGPAVEVAAFAETGKPARIPGPLIRVRAGSIISATVLNALTDSSIVVRGLTTRPAGSDSLILAPGESRRVRFTAGDPGTYFYSATPGTYAFSRAEEREQLAGAFIVDSAQGSPPDRVLVINIWTTPADSTWRRSALTINGRAWPHTERLAALTGDTVRWRVVNASGRAHPMHLHGFYFTLASRGTASADTVVPMGARSLAVTHQMPPFSTMAMSWVPTRAGNWLFHCHLAFHVVPGEGLERAPVHSHYARSPAAAEHMAGLVLGVTVRPRPGERAARRERARRLELFVNEGRRRGHAERALGYVLQRGSRPPARDSVVIPGSLLVLSRGEPTDVAVNNRIAEPVAIHWHGLELESYSDGVTGWSGMGSRVAPAVLPGKTFIARLTMPRAGTFIYHTHMNDIEQLTSGLYGAIVVLEPGSRFDPLRDHVFVLGWDGPDDGRVHLLLNGDSMPPPLELEAGVAHRLRFVNIGPAGRIAFRIVTDSGPARWRRLAKDGADLPQALAVAGPAVQPVAVGETTDVEFTPEPGTYRFVIGDPRAPAVTQTLVVR